MTNTSKAGRNDVCPCGSGKKYKKCHGIQGQNKRGSTMMLIIVGALVAAGLVAGISSLTMDRARTSGVWSAEHGHYH